MKEGTSSANSSGVRTIRKQYESKVEAKWEF